MLHARPKLRALVSLIQSRHSTAHQGPAGNQVVRQLASKDSPLAPPFAENSIAAGRTEIGPPRSKTQNLSSILWPHILNCGAPTSYLSTPTQGCEQATREVSAADSEFWVSLLAAREKEWWSGAAGGGYQFNSGGHRTLSTSPLQGQPQLQLKAEENPKGSSPAVEKTDGQHGKLVLYRGRWIKPLRLLVRLKVLQLTGVAVLAVPIVQYTQHGHVSLGTYAAVALVVGGAAVASTALWFYSRRYVGELSLLLPEKRSVRLSTLDFWGRRQEEDIDISRLIPPLQGLSPGELREIAQHAFVPLEVRGDRQYILSLRHGRLLEKDKLLHLLTHGDQQL